LNVLSQDGDPLVRALPHGLPEGRGRPSVST